MMNKIVMALVLLTFMMVKPSIAQLDSSLTTKYNGSWKVINEWKTAGDTRSIKNGDLYIIKLVDRKMTYIISPAKGSILKNDIMVSNLIHGIETMFGHHNKGFKVKRLTSSLIVVGSDDKCLILKRIE